MRPTIRPLTKEDTNALTLLIEKSFSMSTKDKTSLVKRKFFNTPYKENNVTYGMFIKKKLIGQYANIGCRISRGGEYYTCHLCQDMCIDPEHRGNGYITQISNKVYKELTSDTFSFGFSNSEGVKIDKNNKEYGYYVVGEMKNIARIGQKNKQGYTTQEIKETPQSIAKKESMFYTHYTIDDNQRYLRRRYQQKPGSTYKIYEIYDKDMYVGYLIIKVTKKGCTIMKYNNIKTINIKKRRATIKNIAHQNKRSIINIKVLYNEFRKEVKGNRGITYRNKEKHYFTIKTHTDNHQNSKNIENRILMTGDIL